MRCERFNRTRRAARSWGACTSTAAGATRSGATSHTSEQADHKRPMRYQVIIYSACTEKIRVTAINH
jgi:hypothetical protein